MKIGNIVFIKDLECCGEVVQINKMGFIDVCLDKEIEVEDKSKPMLNGDITNSLNLSENKYYGKGNILYLVKEDFVITYPTYKTKLYSTNINNLIIVNK